LNPHDPSSLPPDLPLPVDDGGCIHLGGAPLSPGALRSTSGREIDLSRLESPTVLFFYPRTGIPGQPPSLGFRGEEWDSIPGARGCTPQSCGFRDLYSQFKALGVGVYGVSTNTTEHQREFKERNQVPFEFLSDSDLRLTQAMRLPTFEFPVETGGPNRLLHRMAWYVEPDALGVARIVKVWYPVFPPNENAAKVLAWLKQRAAITIRPSTPADDAFVRDELTRHWGGTQIWSIGRAYQADRIPGLIAEIGGQPVGLVTYELIPGSYQCEVVTVSSRVEDAGVATRLLEAVADQARKARCTRLFLTATNDNTKAIGFYQTRGWRLAALHKGIIAEARKRKPGIPAVGQRGIPIRDEIELERWLE
jgi:peroxiredoxin/ribosomal protein S18 acetylase RimI-like enzyme